MKTKEKSSRRKPAPKKVSPKKPVKAKQTPVTKKAAPQAVEATVVVPAPVAPGPAILPSTEKSLAVSYMSLRQMVGALGASLPFIVSLGALIIFREPQQPSISAYYYTGMRDVMVGMLTATGFFLFSYNGYGRADSIAGKLACLFALGVAYFPTAPVVDPTPQQNVISNFHLFFAGGFFLTLSYFCLFLFVKTNPGGVPPMTRRKVHRNRVYQTCGAVMVVCMALMAAYNAFHGDQTPLVKLNPTYWLEAIAIVAFGISWLTKGEAILKDEE